MKKGKNKNSYTWFLFAIKKNYSSVGQSGGISLATTILLHNIKNYSCLSNDHEKLSMLSTNLKT